MSPQLGKAGRPRHTRTTRRKSRKVAAGLQLYILDNATDSIFLHDLNGIFLYVNETAAKSRGYSKEELMKIPLGALDTPEYAKLIQQRTKAMVEKGEATFESAHFRKDRSIMPVEVHGRVIELSGRGLVLSVVRDITEKKRNE